MKGLKSSYAIKKEGKYAKSVRIGYGYVHPTTKKYWTKKGYKFVRASSLKSAVEKSFKGKYTTVRKKSKPRSSFSGYGGDIVGGYRLPSGGI